MATALNLFPARITFVNPDGTLTPEAYRALQTLMVRVGGPLGDNGVDVFGDLTGTASLDASITDTVMQSQNLDAVNLQDVMQALASDSFMPDVVQPAITLPAVATLAAPAGGTGTAAGGFDTAVNRDAAITLLNKIRSALIGVGILS